MYCPNCGQQIPDNAKFCPHCGQPLSHQPNYSQQSYQNQQPQHHTGTSMSTAIKIFAYVFMAVYGILAIVYAWSFIKNIFSFFSYFSLSFLLNPLNVLQDLLFDVFDIVLAAVFVFGAIVMFLQANHTEREEYSTYFNILLIAALLQAGIEILVNILGSLIYPFWSGRFFVWGILAAAAGIIIYIILLCVDHVSISSFYAEKGFVGTLQDSFTQLSHEINKAKESYNASHPESAQRDRQEQQEAAQAAQMHVILKVNRGIFSYVILTIITCGIYQLFWVHSVAKDVNIACYGDGKTTGGTLKFVLLGIITCGIYDIYWWYALADRTQAAGITKYHLYMQHGGGNVLLWVIFGWLICGIGQYIGMSHAIQNVNMVCLAHNQQSMNPYQNANINISINQ